MIKFDADAIKTITLFESISHAGIKDCIINDSDVCFIVEPGKLGLAIGRGGYNITCIQSRLKKPVKIFEWNDDVKAFIKNLIPCSKSVKIEKKKDKNIAYVNIDMKERGAVIGKGGRNIQIIKQILKRHHEISEVRLLGR